MKISVYIPSFNQRELLRQAIDSVLNQTLQPHEIIIVDDQSSDDSRDLIAGYHSRWPDLVKPVFHERNLGVTHVRITALNKASGDYITYVDGDDLFLPQKLETEARLIKEGNFEIAFSNTMYFRDNPDNIDFIWAFNKSEMPEKGDMYFHTLSRSFPRNSLFRMELVNLNAWKQIGFHDTELRIYEDFEMRIRLAKRLRINYTIEPLSKIRLGSSGLSHSVRQVHYDSLLYILNKHRHEVDAMDTEKSQKIHAQFNKMLAAVSGSASIDHEIKTQTKNSFTSRVLSKLKRKW